jgi:hypothetical protein
MEEDVRLCPRIVKHEFLISSLMHTQASSPYAFQNITTTCHINAKDKEKKLVGLKYLIMMTPKLNYN